MHHPYGYGFATVDYGSDLLVPPPPLLPLMAIGMYPDGRLVLLLLLMGKFFAPLLLSRVASININPSDPYARALPNPIRIGGEPILSYDPISTLPYPTTFLFRFVYSTSS